MRCLPRGGLAWSWIFNQITNSRFPPPMNKPFIVKRAGIRKKSRVVVQPASSIHTQAHHTDGGSGVRKGSRWKPSRPKFLTDAIYQRHCPRADRPRYSDTARLVYLVGRPSPAVAAGRVALTRRATSRDDDLGFALD